MTETHAGQHGNGPRGRCPLLAIVLLGTIAILAANVVGAGAPSDPSGWVRVQLPGVLEIFISPSMELRGTKYKDMERKAMREFGFDPEASQVMVQQRGLNGLKPEALEDYFRIIIESFESDDGDQLCLTSLDFSEISALEMREIDTAFRAQVEQQITSMPMGGFRLVSWGGTEIAKINGMNALLMRYDRQLKGKAPAKISRYIFFNGDKTHKVQVEYRPGGTVDWHAEAEAALSTLKFVDRCGR